MYVQTSRHIIRSLRHSLEKGMHKYLLDDVWKITFDKIQYNFQCCGIDSYGDWHKIGWLTSYHVNENSDLVKESVLAHLFKLKFSENIVFIEGCVFLKTIYICPSHHGVAADWITQCSVFMILCNKHFPYTYGLINQMLFWILFTIKAV